MLKFLGTTLAAAVLTPFTPLMLLYSLFHTIQPSGNGADMWGTVGIGIISLIGTVGCIILVPIAIANPLFFAIGYGVDGASLRALSVLDCFCCHGGHR